MAPLLGHNGLPSPEQPMFSETEMPKNIGGDNEGAKESSKATSSSYSINGGAVNGLHNRAPPAVQHPGIKKLESSHRVESFAPDTSSPGGPQSKPRARINTYADNTHKKFPRISRPVELIRDSYDVVVIGSGYGGGVAASRMARGGKNVCLLERGKEKWPGEYPVKMTEALKELHLSGNFAPGPLDGVMVEEGDPTGLYHLVMGRGQNAFVGNGLGGTSLLNANVYREVDKGTMTLPEWPKELKKPNELDQWYARARNMLQPAAYPDDWPELPKLNLLEKQAKALGFENKFSRVEQTTRFFNGMNSTGIEMQPSALTGQDCTGLNDGSKSSTLVNYLSDAWNWGAEMFCECEVRYIKQHPDREGYLVYFAWHGSKRGAFSSNIYEDLMWVHAKECVFLGAGSLGTTEILLRSKSLGLHMSSMVGKNMSGNGDILAFGYNCDDQVNALGNERPRPYMPIGPTISGIIDCRDDDNPLDGFVIEEGAVPEALVPIMQFMLDNMPGKDAPKGLSLPQKINHMLAKQGSRFLGPYLPKGSLEKTQVYLIMSHDSNQAYMTLRNDKPVLTFMGVGRSDHANFLRKLLKNATEAVGGTYVDSPFYATMGKQEITVHPIGGACMSRDGTAEGGATNHYGELFTGRGAETYDGLCVTDGAIIPTALGVNPFATITALAERSVNYMAKKKGIRIDYDTENGLINPLTGTPAKGRRQPNDSVMVKAEQRIVQSQASEDSGFSFTEVMSGFIHTGSDLDGMYSKEDYVTATKTARGLCEAARFFLSVRTWDTRDTVHRADHNAMLTGTFVCASLPGSPFMVRRGDFSLFSDDASAPGTKNLKYDFDMYSTEGQKMHFHGYKIVDSSVALNPIAFWRAASTLYVTITRDNIHGNVMGRGILNISPSDFISEAFSLTASGRDLLSRIKSATSFLTYFTRQSASLFFAPLVSLQYPAQISSYSNETKKMSTIKVIASDGVKTFMQVYEADSPDPNLEVHDLFFIPGAAVDYQIFALPTVKTNAINYFTKAGYRCWVLTHRIGMTSAAQHHWTTYDARLDILAALKFIRKTYHEKGEQEKPIYTICHCMGAVAFASGLLDGTIPASWIKGITASQVFMNPNWSTPNYFKTLSPLPLDKLYKFIVGNWFDISSSPDDSFRQRSINHMLRLYPEVPAEMCNNCACHRGTFIFGRMWNHRNLNEATHRQIDRFFGGVNMTLLHLLMQMGDRGFVTSNVPLATNLTTDHNIHRLRKIPMMLFSGSENKVLKPLSTEMTYDILRDRFGSDQYERHVIEGYGHLDCWMSPRSYVDVFPRVRNHVDKILRGPSYKYPGYKHEAH